LPLPSHNDKETVDPYTINVTNDGGNLTLTIFGTNQQPHVENVSSTSEEQSSSSKKSEEQSSSSKKIRRKCSHCSTMYNA